MNDLVVTRTHTGKIYSDIDRKIEFLTVGDYGKENNIKANFLGYTKEINGVSNTEVDLSKKWVATISTQKGCPMHCTFCDVPEFGFFGNCSYDDLQYQIDTIIGRESIKETERFNIHYARMGEPTFNCHVIAFTQCMKKIVMDAGLKAKTIHPVISTMMPRRNANLVDFLDDWCYLKNDVFAGEAGLQFSINSTDELQRNTQFDYQSLSLVEIAQIADNLPMPVGRKYTLNFAVTKDSIVDADILDVLFDKNKFIVKLTPIHRTQSSTEHHYDVTDTYDHYSVYEKFEQPLLDRGWDVIVFVPSVEEDSDRITCGNAIIKNLR